MAKKKKKTYGKIILWSRNECIFKVTKCLKVKGQNLHSMVFDSLWYLRHSIFKCRLSPSWVLNRCPHSEHINMQGYDSGVKLKSEKKYFKNDRKNDLLYK